MCLLIMGISCLGDPAHKAHPRGLGVHGFFFGCLGFRGALVDLWYFGTLEPFVSITMVSSFVEPITLEASTCNIPRKHPKLQKRQCRASSPAGTSRRRGPGWSKCCGRLGFMVMV